MKKYLFLFFLIIQTLSIFSQSIFERDGKFGVRNLKGETVLPAVFHQILNIDYGRFLLVQADYENLGEKKAPKHNFTQEVDLQFWNINQSANWDGNTSPQRQFPFLPNLKYGVFEAGKLDSIVVPCEFSAIISEWNPDANMMNKTSNYLYFVRDSSKYFLFGNEADSNKIAFQNFQLDPQGYWFGNERKWRFCSKSLQPITENAYSEVKFLKSIITDNNGNLLDRRPNDLSMKFQTGSIYLVGDSTGKHFFNSVKNSFFPETPFRKRAKTKSGWLIEMQNGKFGLADDDFRFWLIEPKYDKLEHKKRKIYAFEKDGNSGELKIE